MKKIYLLLFFIPLYTVSFCQSDGFYNTNMRSDAILVYNTKIQAGDTLQLGFGSNSNKDFLYIIQYPTLWNSQTINGVFAPNYLNHFFSNHYMIYKEVVTKRFKKKDINYPIFFIDGKENLRYITDIYSAIAVGEIIALNGKPIEKDFTQAKPVLSKADELKKWKDLLDSGAITKEEYEAQKKKILEQ